MSMESEHSKGAGVGGTSLIDDGSRLSPKTNGSANTNSDSSTNRTTQGSASGNGTSGVDNGKNGTVQIERRPSIAGKALNAMKRCTKRSGKSTTTRKCGAPLAGVTTGSLFSRRKKKQNGVFFTRVTLYPF